MVGLLIHILDIYALEKSAKAIAKAHFKWQKNVGYNPYDIYHVLFSNIGFSATFVRDLWEQKILMVVAHCK